MQGVVTLVGILLASLLDATDSALLIATMDRVPDWFRAILDAGCRFGVPSDGFRALSSVGAARTEP